MSSQVRPRIVAMCVMAFALTVVPNVRAQTRSAMPDSVRAYLDSALQIMHKVLGADTVDWDALRDSLYQRAEGAVRPVDAYRSIRWALRTLNPHSFLQLSSELRERERARTPESEANTSASTGARRVYSPFSNERVPAAELLALADGQVGRLRVPAFSGAQLTAFADTLESLVRELDSADVCGWIVDLRGNGGGNMWPMLAGLGPILGEGKLGEFHGPDGLTGTWYYENGASGIRPRDGEVNENARVSGEPYRVLGTPPVAVLFDGGTASSGEAVAIAFIGRENTRSFGVPSYGFTTANNGFRLPDQANIVLTVGVDADRHGRAYPTALQPDVIVPITDGELPEMPPPGIDPQERAALAWLAEQASCGR